MLLVILGAGASSDSHDIHGPLVEEWRPPLASQLFEHRGYFLGTIDEFPDSRSLVVALRGALANPSSDLEQELDKVSVKATTDARAATQLMAIRYYLRQIIRGCSDHWFQQTHGCTNYHFLVERLDEWARNQSETVLYVTFNYDTLLQRAIQDSGPKLSFQSMDDYIAHDRVKVFKLHGSCDWAHVVHIPQPWTHSVDRDYVIDHAKDLDIPQEIVFRPDQQSGTRGQAWVPALSVPIQNKGDFECPPEHVETLQELLPKVDRLLVIGWRATEKHFLRMLGGKNPRSMRTALISCRSKASSGSTWLELEDAFHISPRPPVFNELDRLGVSNFENELGFSDLIARPTLFNALLG